MGNLQHALVSAGLTDQVTADRLAEEARARRAREEREDRAGAHALAEFDEADGDFASYVDAMNSVPSCHRR